MQKPSTFPSPRLQIRRQGVLGRGMSKDLTGRNSMVCTEKQTFCFSRGVLSSNTPRGWKCSIYAVHYVALAIKHLKHGWIV